MARRAAHGRDPRRARRERRDEPAVLARARLPARDAAVERFRDGTLMDDPRMNPETNPMPFDGKRMIFGGFVPVVALEK